MKTMILYRLPSLLLCVALAGCGYFIPPEKSVARYNSVIGEPRHPELNPTGNVAAAPVTPVATATQEPAYPQVSDETRMRADAVMATDVPPPMPAPAPQTLARHVPEENIAANTSPSDYPMLNSVPPSPSSTDKEAAARLARVRAQLEQERTQAGSDKEQLSHDAASEPSLAPTNGPIAITPIVPMPEPVSVAPIAPPNGVNAAPSISVPMAKNTPVTPTISMALPPPPPAYNPPAPIALGTIPNYPSAPVSYPAPSVTPVNAPAPTYTPSAVSYNPNTASANFASTQEPIVLHAPQAPTNGALANIAYAEPASAPSYADPSNNVYAQPMPAAAAGGFNPLEGAAAPASSGVAYSSSGYLPASRYAQRGY